MGFYGKLIGIIIVLIAAGPVSAWDAEEMLEDASLAMEAGNAAYEAGNYDTALFHFRAAHTAYHELHYAGYYLDQHVDCEEEMEVADSRVRASLFQLGLFGTITPNGWSETALYQDLHSARARHGNNHVEVALREQHLAEFYLDEGDTESALEHYLKSRDILLENYGENYPQLTELYSMLSQYHFALGDSETAGDYLQKSVAIARHNAELQYNRSEYELAQNFLERVVSGLRTLYGETHTAMARTIELRGRVEHGQVRKLAALEDFAQALAVLEALDEGENADAARVYLSRGNLYFDEAKHPLAQRDYELALSLITAEEEPLLSADIHGALGSLHLANGDPARALLSIDKAIGGRITMPPNERITLAQNYLDLGTIYDIYGDHPMSRESHEVALALLEDRYGAGSAKLVPVLSRLGELYSMSGDHRKGEEYILRGMTILQAGRPYNYIQAQALMSLARVRMAAENDNGALWAFNMAHQCYLKSVGPNHPDVARLFLEQGKLEAKRGDNDKATEYYREGIESLYLLANEPVAGMGGWDWRAETLRPLPVTVALLYELAMLQAEDETLSRQERLEAAYATTEIALDSLTRLRGRLTQESRQHQEEQFSFIPALVLYLQNELASAGMPQDEEMIFAAAEMSAAWSFVEMMAEARVQTAGILTGGMAEDEQFFMERFAYLDERAGVAEADAERLELEEKFESWINLLYRTEPRYAALKYPRPARLAVLQNILADDELCLEYIVSPFGGFVVAIDKNSLTLHYLKNAEELLIAAKEACDALTTGQRHVVFADGGMTVLPEGAEALEALYQVLFKPVNAQLEGKRLIIVPAEELEGIAIGALRNPDGLYLTETNRLAYAPSLAILLLQRTLDKDITENNSLLALGNPLYPTDAERDDEAGLTSRSYSEAVRAGWVPLPGTAQEINAIAATYAESDVTVLLEANATEQNIRSENWNDYSYLHFACHGELGYGPALEPALVLSQTGNRSPEDGFLTLSEVIHQPHSSRLSVLSACNTGRRGERSPRSGVSSMARAFLLSGSDAVIVSLWSVSDEATAQLMAELYRAMKEDGLGPAAALHQAQQTLRDNPLTALPFFWAPFIIVGDGH